MEKPPHFSCFLGEAGKIGKEETLLLMKRDDGGEVHHFSPEETFDEMSRGLASAEITRGRAIKLAGAALVASALGVSFASEGQAQADVTTEQVRRRCRRRRRNFCRSRDTGSVACCRRRFTACCGENGAACCRGGTRCEAGQCVPLD